MVSNADQESMTQNSGAPFFRYNSPLIQVILIALVCFCCPGMFNALSGMGGGGQVSHTASNNSLTALYAAFSISGILGGAIYNILGPHLTLLAGCSTYVFYTSSFLYYNHYHHQVFAVVAGALLGLGAGLLWAAQGAIMTSYPPRNRKGTYISIFWSIFNMGGVIGGLIPFILNYHHSEAHSVNDATYIGFMLFMSLGTLLSLAILPASKVVRDDGSNCTNVLYSNVKTEFLEILKLFSDWKVLLMVPAAWSSNFFYPYQFNDVNGVLFNLRTRGLNSVFYWGAQMLGSVGIGYVMDFSFERRRVRGMVGVVVVAVVGTAIWGGGLVNQIGYSENNLPEKLDFKDSGSHVAGPFVLYCSFGLLDAMFQSLVYWIIGALADDSEILSSNEAFENACLEFDEVNLKPTYKVLWGVPGRSNAINIAERLGLPSVVVDTARKLYGSASAEIDEVITDMERFKQDYQELLDEAQHYLKHSRGLYNSLLNTKRKIMDCFTIC